MNQQPKTAQLYPVEQGDKLDLVEVWGIVIKYKFTIISFAVIATIVAIFHIKSLPNIYKTELLMVPSSLVRPMVSSGNIVSSILSGGRTSSTSTGVMGDRALVQLKTRNFLNGYIQENDLKQILFADQWDSKKMDWIDKKEPSDEDAFELFNGMLGAGGIQKSDANLVSLYILWEEPSHFNKIANLTNDLARRINIEGKKREIKRAEANISFLKKEIEMTDIFNFQLLLYDMIESQMQKIMIANVSDEFIFSIIEPAVLPKKPKQKHVVLILFLGLLLGTMLGIFVAITINFFKNKN